MASGRSIQLDKQTGEYLVAHELARRGFLVARFSRNVPDFDIIAAAANGNSLPIQVNTIRGGQWQLSADKFFDIRFKGEKQILGSKVVPRIPHVLCILALATEYGTDRSYILEWKELRDIAVSCYSAWLGAKDGVTPRNYKSLHCSVSPNQLAEFENQWVKIAERV